MTNFKRLCLLYIFDIFKLQLIKNLILYFISFCQSKILIKKIMKKNAIPRNSLKVKMNLNILKISFK